MLEVGAVVFAKKASKLGVKVAFVFTGGAIAAILDALEAEGIKLIPYDHELDAAYAAEGYARSTGQPTLVAVTSGPGATNLITGIAGAWFDSIPILFVTGQVKSNQRTDFSVHLQRGFQEIDVVKSTEHLTKMSICIESASQIEIGLDSAFSAMLSGRPGPAVVDITMDAQMTNVQTPDFSGRENEDFYSHLTSGYAPEKLLSLEKKFGLLYDELERAEKPLIIFGGGIQWLPTDLVKSCVEKLGVSFITTYGGLNILPLTHPLNRGIIGVFGHREANKAFMEASNLFIFGARLPFRALPNLDDDELKIVHEKRKWSINLEALEMTSHPIGPIEYNFEANLIDFFKFIEKRNTRKKAKNKDFSSGTPKFNEDMFVAHGNEIGSNLSDKTIYSVTELIRALNKALPDKSIVFGDVGQNIVALATGLNRDRGQKLFSSWANSPMGFSLPAALGAVESNNSAPKVAIIGDGGIRTALTSLPNMVKSKGKLKTIIWDNSGYSTIVDHLDAMLDGRRTAVTPGSGLAPLKIAEILKASGLRVHVASEELSAEMTEFFSNEDDILIVNVDPSIRMVPLTNKREK